MSKISAQDVCLQLKAVLRVVHKTPRQTPSWNPYDLVCHSRRRPLWAIALKSQQAITSLVLTHSQMRHISHLKTLHRSFEDPFRPWLKEPPLCQQSLVEHVSFDKCPLLC